jgi:3-hydroxybutyryl-CoA dehydrogenase
MRFTRVGIVGAGTMGQGIAINCGAAGLDVLLLDRTEELLQQALARIDARLQRSIEKWRRTPAEKKAIMGRIHPAASLADLASAQIVIEAIPEDLDAKIAVFAELDRVCPPETLLATNTSTLSITQIAAKTSRGDRVIGLHFLHPASRVTLVEIVRGLQTSDATYLAAREFVRLLGKTAIEVFEYPGYVTTRVMIPFLNEAMHVVMEGVASAEDVDTAMKLGYNLPIGPLELADRMGLDEVMRWMQYLFEELGDSKYRPCPLLRKMLRAGHLGVKSGRGFFEYDAAGRMRTAEATS